QLVSLIVVHNAAVGQDAVDVRQNQLNGAAVISKLHCYLGPRLLPGTTLPRGSASLFVEAEPRVSPYPGRAWARVGLPYVFFGFRRGALTSFKTGGPLAAALRVS